MVTIGVQCVASGYGYTVVKHFLYCRAGMWVEVRSRCCIEAASSVGLPVVGQIGDCNSPPRFELLLCVIQFCILMRCGGNTARVSDATFITFIIIASLLNTL